MPTRIRPRTDSCAEGSQVVDESYDKIKKKYKLVEVAKKSTKSENPAHPLNYERAQTLVIPPPPTPLSHTPPPYGSLIPFVSSILFQSQLVISAARISCSSDEPMVICQCLCRWHRILQSPLLSSCHGGFDIIKMSVFESPHPYPDDCKVTHKISCHGALRMEISFDPRSATVSRPFICIRLR